MPAPFDRSTWLRQAREILAQDHGTQSGRITVTVQAEGGAETRLTLTGEVESNGHALPSLSPLERSILRAVRQSNGAPVVAKVIASRCGVKCDGGFRAILRNLTEREPAVLLVSAHGYTLGPGAPRT